MRLFYNYSDIFRASAANFTDVFGNPLRAAFGETRDYGVKLDLFNERLYLTATRYETAVVDSTFDFKDIRKAHERMESNATFGKIVLTW